MLTQYRDPKLSIWQSAIDKALRDRQRVALRTCEIVTQAKELDARLNYGDLDPNYEEAVVNYLRYQVLQNQPIPYIAPTGPDDSVESMPDICKIAIVGDWGTGQQEAESVLERIASRQPDIVIHLGDIYYSGTVAEAEACFLSIFRRVFEDKPPRILTLAGNHDMYAGGSGYYWLLKQIGQRASYFCLRNRYWQFVGVDTGYNDRNPLTCRSDQTYLRTEELSWLKAQVNDISLKTVLLSHHPLFTAFDSIDRAAVNGKLYEQVSDLIPCIARWYWGHEHDAVIYKPHLAVTARLLGYGAFPVAVDERRIHQHPEVAVEDIHLGDNGVTFYHGYAFITLNGPNARADHYECAADSDKLTFTEMY